MRSRIVAVVLVGLFLVAGVALASPVSAQPEVARGLELVGATDFDDIAPTRNTEIEVRGDFVYIGSFFPLTDDGLSWVKVVDVSDRTRPALVSTFLVPGTVRDTQVNNDVDRCGYGADLAGVDDPACNTVLLSTQNAPATDDVPARHGIWLMDARDPTNIQPWGWDPDKPLQEQVAFIPFPEDGAHNGFLFGDFAVAAGIEEATFEMWDIRPLFREPDEPPVRVATYFATEDNRPVQPLEPREESHDVFVQRNPDGRVLMTVARPYLAIVDVTDVVAGATTGDISDHLVAFNNYVNADGEVTVTRPRGSGHYAEPTDDGRITYAGDEAGCGEPGIIHIFDTSNLPQVGETPKELVEVGTLTWPTSNVPQCNNRNADDFAHDRANRNGDTDLFCRTGHNFRIYGDVMTHGAYCDGVFVWDISNPTSPALMAQFKAVRNHDGKAAEGEVFSRHLTPFVWQAVSDGDPDALLDGEQFIYASDIVNGLYVLRMRPTGVR